MPTYVQWAESDKQKKYRLIVILGEDAALRADALDKAVAQTAPQERVTLFVGDGEGESGSAKVWDAVATQPMAGITSRLVVVHSADKMRNWTQLKTFIDHASWYPETVLCLILDRPSLGVRSRSKKSSVPGIATWETTYTEWEEWIRHYSSAGVITCSSLTIDPDQRQRRSPACRWLSFRLPVTQKQAEVLWARCGESSAMARDVLISLRTLGLADATGLPSTEWQGLVARVVAHHGSEELVDHLLFERRSEALATVAERGFTQSDWSRVLGLLAQRLDWLGPLNEALATNEKLDQVMRRLGIHQRYILYYAHRADARHNVARRYDAKKVARCRRLLGELDAALHRSSQPPIGLGELLVASW